MRVLPPSLAQMLDSGVTNLAMAWRITRGDGLVVAVTGHDRDLTFDGTLFVASYSFVGGDHEQEVNLAPDRTALSGALTIGTISETDLALGRWDQAEVEAFWVDWTNPRDFIPMWQGFIAGASWRGGAFELDIVGPESILNREIGRVYARTCDAALGDGRCKVDLTVNGRTLSATIIAVMSDRCVAIAKPSGPISGDFVGGKMTILSGIASSWRCDITRIELYGNTWLISMSRPFPVSPVIGDTIEFSMGCDKAFATCKTRFSNVMNFRGQPTMPGDDVAFGGPAATGNDGGRR
jgi:uncharacterized phage protein (TIGR02218 family)